MSDRNSSRFYAVWYYISLTWGFLLIGISMSVQFGWHLVLRKKQDSIEKDCSPASTHQHDKQLVDGSVTSRISSRVINGGNYIVSHSRQALTSAARYCSSYVPSSIGNVILGNFLTDEDIVVDPKFTIYLYEGELININKWVAKYDDIETGGDLFGLWIDEYNIVVQSVLGPGKKCKRTACSFFQDVEYLRDCGNVLTQKHGLCTIGQWHSHHRLGLLQPSSGDENTVWSNMPGTGLQRFVVCIATISRHNKVNVKPFLFEVKNGNRLPIVEGKFQLLPGISPLRENEVISETIQREAEPMNNIIDI